MLTVLSAAEHWLEGCCWLYEVWLEW